MPAGITERDSMFATRVAPWHKLGTLIADRDAVTSHEALEYAGMNWGVGLAPVYTNWTSGNNFNVATEIPDKKAVIRLDTHEPLGVVGNYYVPVQNAQHFDFFDEVVGSGEAIYETAGTLFGGKRIWILARIPEYIGWDDDPIAPYVLLSSSHDGSTPTTMQWTPIRVVCWNTLSAAMSGNDNPNVRDRVFKTRHTRNGLFTTGKARQLLEYANQYFKGFNESINRMRDARMTAGEVDQFLRTLYNFDPKKDNDEQNYWVRTPYEETSRLLYNSPTISANIRDTRYGVFNAVTEYLDHVRVSKSVERLSTGGMEKALASSWGMESGMSTSTEIRQQAWGMLQQH